MKTIIAGSRLFNFGVWLVDDAVVKSGFKITEVVSGGARGIDFAGELWAEGKNIPVRRFLPDWSVGKGAGHIRNKEMALYADALVLVWDGESKGSANMLQNAKERGLEIYQYIVE